MIHELRKYLEAIRREKQLLAAKIATLVSLERALSSHSGDEGKS